MMNAPAKGVTMNSVLKLTPLEIEVSALLHDTYCGATWIGNGPGIADFFDDDSNRRMAIIGTGYSPVQNKFLREAIVFYDEGEWSVGSPIEEGKIQSVIIDEDEARIVAGVVPAPVFSEANLIADQSSRGRRLTLSEAVGCCQAQLYIGEIDEVGKPYTVSYWIGGGPGVFATPFFQAEDDIKILRLNYAYVASRNTFEENLSLARYGTEHFLLDGWIWSGHDWGVQVVDKLDLNSAKQAAWCHKISTIDQNEHYKKLFKKQKQSAAKENN